MLVDTNRRLDSVKQIGIWSQLCPFYLFLCFNFLALCINLIIIIIIIIIIIRLLLGLGVGVEPQVELLTHCELDFHTFKSNVP
jgi:hypothetical protein